MDKIINEIKYLHQFFQEYFSGEVPLEKINVLHNHIADEFQLIAPEGRIITKPQLMKIIQDNYGKRRVKIWTENECVNIVLGRVIIATYEEIQQTDEDETRRISTAIFKIQDRPIWFHVHETWLH